MRSAVAFGWRPIEFGVNGYGERLVEAVAAWQRERLLPVTGYVDERTYRALVTWRDAKALGSKRQEIDRKARGSVGPHASHPVIIASEALSGLIVYDPHGTAAGVALAAAQWRVGARAVVVAPPTPVVVDAMAQRQRGAWCVVAADPDDVPAALQGPAAPRVVGVAVHVANMDGADPSRVEVLVGRCDPHLPRVSIPVSDLLDARTFREFSAYNEHFNVVMPLVDLGRRDAPQQTMATAFKWWPATMGKADGKLVRPGRKITFPIWTSPHVAPKTIWRWRDECIAHGLRGYGYSTDVLLEHKRDVLLGSTPCPDIQVDTPYVDRLRGRR